MRINDDHMYHGSALTQIAEHPQFTAINGIRLNGQLSRSAFLINDSVGVYLKYANNPQIRDNDYVFTFMKTHKDEISILKQRYERVFIAMICVADRQICCISQQEFDSWIQARSNALGKDEETSTFLVNLPAHSQFRVNMNLPGRRKIYLGEHQLVPRNRFPQVIFEP